MVKRTLFIAGLSLTAAAASAYSPSLLNLALTPREATYSSFSTKQIVVKIRPGQETAAKTLFSKSKLSVMRTISGLGWQTLKLPSGMTVDKAISTLKGKTPVLSVGKSWIYRPEGTPNDALFPQQYGAQRMQLPLAWDLAPEAGEGVTVAVIDTGIQKSHPDLSARLVKGFDFGDNDADPEDTDGHGTHVSGIVAATGNNGIGVAGNAYRANIMPLRVFGASGATNDIVVNAMKYAVDNGASVINMSLGSYPETEDPILVDAVAYATSRNVLVVASAGNDTTDNGTRYHSPSDIPDVVCVGASTSSDGQASFSNYGTPVDVAAPGEDIMSTVIGGYGNNSGTSMAAPQVAGLAALILGYAGGPGSLTQAELRGYIENNCDPIGGWIQKGRVNAYRSIAAVPVSITDKATATGIGTYEGTVQGGDASTLSDKDGLSTTIVSTRKASVGLVGGMMSTFTPTPGVMAADQIRTATIQINATGDNLAVLQVYLYDSSTGKWVLYTTKPTNGTAQSFSMRMDRTTLLKYAPSGDLQIMLRAYVPTRLASRVRGVTQIDELSVTYSGRLATVTP